MSGDPTLDYLSSGGAALPPSVADPTQAFLESGGQKMPTTASGQSNTSSPDMWSHDAITEFLRHEGSSLGASAYAGGKVIWDAATGKIHSIAQADQEAQDIIRRNTYQVPKDSAAGMMSDVMASPANPLNWVPKGLEYAGKGVTAGLNELDVPSQYSTLVGPALEAGGDVAYNAAGLVKGVPAAAGKVPPLVRGAREVPVEQVQAALDSQAAASPQSMGAAAAAPRVSDASPELLAGIRDAATRSGGVVNPAALTRQLEADSIGVRLSEGQALQDPARISLEQNRRGASPQIAQGFNNQNTALVQRLQDLRDQVGPEVFSTNPVEHGDTLIKAYQDKAAAADANIASKYQAFADSSGGTIDQSGVLGRLEAQFKKEKVWNQDGTQKVMSSLKDIADNPNMTADDLEAYQTSLARTIRSTSDGHETYAAGQAKAALYDTPVADAVTAAQKQLGMAARAAAKAQFDALDADPAYKAAVNGTVPPDRFVQKFIVSAPRDDVATMQANLADNPTAQQTMSVAALDHLRRSAGIDDLGNGNFSQANFNKNLQALQPKLGSLVDPKTAEQLQTIGNVARYTQAQPRGSFVNNSNTTTAAMAEFAKGTLEQAVNAKAGGLPVGTWGRQALGRRSMKAYADRVFRPGAGIDVNPTQ